MFNQQISSCLGDGLHMPVEQHDTHPGDCILHELDAAADLTGLAARYPQRYPFLLQSVAHGTPQARFDILFAFPGETLLLKHPSEADFLTRLDARFGASPVSRPMPNVPFRGGWFIYLGYELAQQIEPVLNLSLANDGLPVAFATRIPTALIHDHQAGRFYAVAEGGAGDLLAQMLRDAADVTSSGSTPGADPHITEITEDEADGYLAAVRRIKEYITEGDVFQVNLSRAWRARCSCEGDGAMHLYRRLRQRNPAPFAGLARFGGHAIISSSPERLVSVKDGVVETRPIAGTRPRGLGMGQDDALRRELIGHPKERAEHIMLIDLERNDLGRIAEPGSVKVDELMTLESYAHVHHIVSNVRARPRPGTTPGQIIRAVFPGGTITGCPKVRCMEIIAELEQAARGPYTGSMGYLNHDGSMDLNILIRTLHWNNGAVSLRAGAGIVADSVPEEELAETRAKARGLLLALGAALD